MVAQSRVEELVHTRCKPCEGGMPPIGDQEAAELLKNLPGWEKAGGEIRKAFKFRNFYETMAFVNAVAWIAHREDHHPDMEVGYNRCVVRYSTHAIGGLSENDFICAAKVQSLEV
ncbi:MAG: 4a-hydroxytetrahydrobiopterin dehydratase [Bacillota bacterium]